MTCLTTAEPSLRTDRSGQSNQTLTTGTWTAINWDGLTTGKWTPGTAGIYLIQAGVYVTAMTEDDTLHIALGVNDVITYDVYVRGAGTGGCSVNATFPEVTLTNQEYVQIYVKQTTGSNKTVDTGVKNFFTGRRVGA